MRLLIDRFGQQAALFEADVARRCADETGNGVAFHVFGHVKALQRHAQREGQLSCDFGFTHAGGTGKQEAAYRPVRRTQARTGHFYRRCERVYGGILAEHHIFQVACQIFQHLFVVVRNGFFRNAGDFGDNGFDLGFADDFFLLGLGQDFLRCAGFINDVYGFVGQEAFVDVAGGELGRSFECAVGVAHVVEVFKHGLQAAQDFDGFGHAGFGDVDFLKTAAQGMVFGEDGAVFVISGRADTAQRTFSQRGFEQVGRVHRAAAGAARADNGVDFVDKEYRAVHFFQGFDHGFHARFEVAAVFCSRQQRAHIEQEDGVPGQHFGHVAADDLVCQAFGQRGFAHARLAHQKRIVFAAAAQYLYQPLHFVFAAD